jgi:hypothetical protein
MKLGHLALIPVLLITSAFSCSRQPVASASHPPIVDLSCPGEPEIVRLLEQDPTGLAFDAAVREAGEQCRQALARVCRWHKERGAEVSCPAAILTGSSG